MHTVILGVRSAGMCILSGLSMHVLGHAGVRSAGMCILSGLSMHVLGHAGV